MCTWLDPTQKAAWVWQHKITSIANKYLLAEGEMLCRSKFLEPIHCNLVLQATPPGPWCKETSTHGFSWKICFHYSGRSNPAEEIGFLESNLTEARFDSLPIRIMAVYSSSQCCNVALFTATVDYILVIYHPLYEYMLVLQAMQFAERERVYLQ